jgi:phosphatidylinositol alpha-mannosyltransferase
VLSPPQEEGRLGEFFAAGDHQALARAVLRVLTQPDPLRASRAQEAARGYDWSSVGSNVLAVYRAALSAAPVPSAAKDVG